MIEECGNFGFILAARKMKRERSLFRAAKTENPIPRTLLRICTETFAMQAITSSFHFILLLDL